MCDENRTNKKVLKYNWKKLTTCDVIRINKQFFMLFYCSQFNCMSKYDVYSILCKYFDENVKNFI